MVLIITIRGKFYGKLYDLDTMKQYHFISRDDAIDIFKDVLNNDVAKHIASYISHPIHEYIGQIRLLLHFQTGLKLMKNKDSAPYFIKTYGYMVYEKERLTDIKIMNGQFPYMGFAKPYIPVTNHSQKNNTMEWIGKLGVKVYKSWTKQKMIKHYYKSVV